MHPNGTWRLKWRRILYQFVQRSLRMARIVFTNGQFRANGAFVALANQGSVPPSRRIAPHEFRVTVHMGRRI